jgi:hypothetical protein
VEHGLQRSLKNIFFPHILELMVSSKISASIYAYIACIPEDRVPPLAYLLFKAIYEAWMWNLVQPGNPKQLTTEGIFDEIIDPQDTNSRKQAALLVDHLKKDGILRDFNKSEVRFRVPGFYTAWPKLYNDPYVFRILKIFTPYDHMFEMYNMPFVNWLDYKERVKGNWLARNFTKQIPDELLLPEDQANTVALEKHHERVQKKYGKGQQNIKKWIGERAYKHEVRHGTIEQPPWWWQPRKKDPDPEYAMSAWIPWEDADLQEEIDEDDPEAAEREFDYEEEKFYDNMIPESIAWERYRPYDLSHMEKDPKLYTNYKTRKQEMLEQKKAKQNKQQD